MGGNKAMTLLAGLPMAAHVANALGEAAALGIVGDAAAAKALAATNVADPIGAPRGPLSGVLAALEWADRERAHWLALASCDAPLLGADIISRLRLAAGARALVCAVTPSGLEPLISLWRVDLLEHVRAALAGGQHPPVHAFMRALSVAELPLKHDEVMNVNTPADLARAEHLLAMR